MTVTALLVATAITSAAGASATTSEVTGSSVPHFAGRRGVIKPQRFQSNLGTYDQAVGPPLLYWGGPVLHRSTIYLVYWDPGNRFDPAYTDFVSQFERNVSAESGTSSNVYSVAQQYGDSSGPAAYDVHIGGVLVDHNPYPAQDASAYGGYGSGCPLSPGVAACVNEADIFNELNAVRTSNGIASTSDLTMAVLLPQGVDTCFDAGGVACNSGLYFCAYHDGAAAPDGTGNWVGIFPFEVIPYPSSGCASTHHPNGTVADDTVNFLSHEQIETMTDPRVVAGQPFDPGPDGNGALDDLGWYDPYGGPGLGGFSGEVADKCVLDYGPEKSTSFGPYNQTINGAHYLLQMEWSNALAAVSDPGSSPSGFGCVQNGGDHAPVPALTATVSGSVARFDASGTTDPDPGDSIASYLWTFGDAGGTQWAVPGTSQMMHHYTRPGTYPVELHVTDSHGATAAIRTTVTITTPAPTTTNPFHAAMTTTLDARRFATGSGQATRLGAISEFGGFGLQTPGCVEGDQYDASKFPTSITFDLATSWKPTNGIASGSSQQPNGSDICVAYQLTLTNTDPPAGSTFSATGTFQIVSGSGTYVGAYGSGTVSGTCTLSADLSAFTCSDVLNGSAAM